MNEVLLQIVWLSAVLLPLVLAGATVSVGLSRAAIMLAPLAPLPTLALAVFGARDADLSWLLLGTRFGLTEVTAVFAVFTTIVWIAAGFYALVYTKDDANRRRFFAFFLVTMAGNLGLIVARDFASFYFFFTLMSFAAYGLIIHDATERARRAARIYLTMVIFGEAFLLPAVIVSASVAEGFDDLAPALAGSPLGDAVILLALVGFGVKAGALPVHLWLPLAHPAAPTPASAVLSGTMIKAGLLGWILFIPAGETALPAFGTLCLVAGLVAVFYGVFAGLAQSEPKSILAYSSISQMGLMTVALGAGMVAPGAWPVALLAILVYATHHALAKGALFLGVGVADHAKGTSARTRAVAVGGLVLAALVLAGVPLTSGALAKEFLKEAGYASTAPWDSLLTPLIEVGAIGTALLMLRFLQKVWPEPGESAGSLRGLFAPWVSLLAGMFVFIAFAPQPPNGTLYALLSFSALWPALAGAAVFFAAVKLAGKTRRRLYPQIPEGDLLVPLSKTLLLARNVLFSGLASGREGFGGLFKRISRNLREAAGLLDDVSVLAELWLRRWTVAAGFLFALTVVMFALAALR